MKPAVLILHLLFAFTVCVLPPVLARKSVLSHWTRNSLAETTHQAATCKVLASVCESSMECCSGNCVLFVCALPVVSEKEASKHTIDHSLALRENTHRAATCKVLASVCESSMECCSGNCVLFVCALPVISEKEASKHTIDHSLARRENTHQAATCKVLASVCESSMECCSGNCVLFVCALPVISEEASKHTIDHSLALRETAHQAATCKVLASVCESSMECCSGNCVLFVCALPVVSEKEASKHTIDHSLALRETTHQAATCKVLASVCESSMECCSGNCVLFVCALPVVSEKEASKHTIDHSLALRETTHQAATCKVLASVCESSMECCSGNCVLFVCALPVVSEKEASKHTIDHSLALRENTHQAATCKVLASVCESSMECCSGNCVLFVCALPVISEEASKHTVDHSLALRENTHQAATCKVLASVCESSIECCSGNCVLFVCALPVVSEKEGSVVSTAIF